MELLHLLRDVGGCAPGGEQRRDIRTQARTVSAAAERGVAETYDLERERSPGWGIGRGAVTSGGRG